MKYLGLSGLKYFYTKYIKPLKAAAFRSVSNNLTTAESGSAVLDAYQGKVLKDNMDTEVKKLKDKDTELEGQIKGASEDIKKVLEAGPTTIYDANNNIVTAVKIGNLVIARFVIDMKDTTERTLTLKKGYGPSQGFFIPLIRSGVVAGNAWLTNNGENGTLTYRAAENNYGTYSCSVAYYANV